MHTRAPLLALAMIATFAAAGHAEELDLERYMPLSEVRPGMVGVGKTTLEGANIIEFQVNVLAILKNVGPKQDVIMVRCRGAGLEHTGVIAGMSGSPVYVDGRLIGALAFAFPWVKAPIAGLQPIEQMLSVTDEHAWARRKAPQARAGGAATEGGAAAGFSVPVAALGLPEPPEGLRGQETFDLEPIRTPVMVGGASARVLKRLREAMEPFGMTPMRGGGAEYELPEVARLEPGAPLGVGLMRGDLDITGMGTITEVVGDRLYGFGHAVFGLGEADYPLMTGVVQVVVPSVAVSFRLSAPVQEVGRLLWDEETAVFGRISHERASMVPISVRVRGPDAGAERQYRYEMVRHRLLSPMLGSIATGASLEAHSALPRDHTLAYRLSIKPVGHEPIVRDNLAVSPFADGYLVAQARGIIALLMENPFGNLGVESIEVEVEVEPVSRRAEIETARVLRNAVRPGGTLPVALRIRPWRTEPEWMTIQVQVPDDYPDGVYALTVCGGDEAARQEMREMPARFRPRDLESLLRVLRYEKRRDRLYVRLEAPGEGLAIGPEELPNLPATMRAVLAESARRRVYSVRRSRVTTTPVPYVLAGRASLTVTVDRHAPEP